MLKQLETTDKASIQERKIRVIWLPATSDEASGNNSPPPAVTPNRSSISNAGVRPPPSLPNSQLTTLR